MGASLYEPINVYKSVAANIGIVDGPFEYLTVGGAKLPLPFTTRMTVVRLANKDLFLHSPIKFEEGLANELLRLGAVRHLVSPNQFHYAHIGEWAMAFPNAVSWASPRVRERARARHVALDFTRDLGTSPPEEWRKKSTKLFFPAAISRRSFFSTALQRRSYLQIRSSTSNLTRLPSRGGRPQSSPGCTIHMVRSSSACDCRLSSSGRRRRLQSEKSTHGNRGVFSLAMADVLTQMLIK